MRVVPLSTRRQDRAATLAPLAQAMGAVPGAPGNHIAFFSSFDHMEMALRAFEQRWPSVPVWAQARQMDEPSRQAWLQRF